MSSLRVVSEGDPGSPVVYVFPHAGGSVSDYRLLTAPGSGLAWTAIQPRGRGSRYSLEPLEFVELIVADLVGDIAADVVRHARPFGFFGHSFGALIAFEVTRALREAGSRLPDVLWLSSFPAPHLIPESPALGSLPDGELLAFLSDRFGAIPDEVLEHPELAELVAQYIRSDYRALERYAPPTLERLPVDITVSYGSADGERPDEVLEWRDWCGARFESMALPGGHFYVQDESNAGALRHRMAVSFSCKDDNTV